MSDRRETIKKVEKRVTKNSPNDSHPKLHIVIATKEDISLADIFTRKNIVFFTRENIWLFSVAEIPVKHYVYIIIIINIILRGGLQSIFSGGSSEKIKVKP